MEYEGDGWLGYDWRFRQLVAATPTTTWARIEPTLLNMVFAGNTRTTRCKYFFGQSHSEQKCELPPTQGQGTKIQLRSASGSLPQSFQVYQHLISNEWNYNPAPQCPIPRCCYKHICLPCSQNPTFTDKAHKAMFCTNYPLQSASHTINPSSGQVSTSISEGQVGLVLTQTFNYPGPN